MNNSTGNKIYTLRKARGMTQEELGAKIGVTNSEEELALLSIYRKLPVKARLTLLQTAFDLEDANR